MGQLAALAEARGAGLSSEGYELYCKQLRAFPEAHMREAIGRLAIRPRGEYETAYPSLGTIAAECRQVAVERAAKEKPKFCGRCWDGAVRLANGDVVRCECCCEWCGNSGLERVSKGEHDYVRRCRCRSERGAQ